MTFLTPLVAGIAAAIAIPTLVILYFLKLRRRDVEISSTLLWKKAIQDLQANAPFQKLRNNILLILQLIALAAALLAIAQPEFKDTTKTEGRKIIMIDRSASMQSLDGSGTGIDPAKPDAKLVTRLEAAKKKAIELVEEMKEPGLLDEKGEEAMVIAFDTTAITVQNFTSSKADLKRAIEGIETTDAPSSLELAFTLAKGYTGAAKFEDQVRENVGFVPTASGATIHLISDGRLPDADKIQTGASDSVKFHAIGTKDAPNVGITGLRADRAFDKPTALSIFVGLQSTAREPRRVDVELAIDGVVSNVRDVLIAPATKRDGVEKDTAGETQESDVWEPGLGGFVFPVERPQGGICTVRISTAEADNLTMDNVAYLVIPPAKRLSVALVTEGNLFIKTALEGMNLSKLDVRRPAEFQTLLDEGKTSEYDVVVFDRHLPLVKVAAAAAVVVPGAAGGGATPAPATPAGAGGDSRQPGLPPGRSLVIGAVPPPPLGLIDGGEGEATNIVDWKRDHPVLGLANLDKITIVKSRKAKLAEDSSVESIAQDIGGNVAIAEVTDATSRAIIVPWDVGESDWAFDPGWVLFVASSVIYLSDVASGSIGETVRPGETLATRLPRGVSDARITLPDKTPVKLEPAADGSVAFGPVNKQGVYTVSWLGPAASSDGLIDGRNIRPVAANLTDPSESNIATVDRLGLAKEVVSAATEKESKTTRKLWPWLLLGALAVVMFEWWIYNRKVAL